MSFVIEPESNGPDDDEKPKSKVRLNEAIFLANQAEQQRPVELRVYAQRWIVLAVVALLNCSNTILWISLSPVNTACVAFYGYRATWFSVVFIVVTIPVAFGAMYAGNRFGIRSAVLVAACTNGLGACIRLASSWLSPGLRFPVAIAGQAIAATAYPFIMILPTPVAGAWFSENQRGVATTIGLMSNPLGVLLANFIVPLIIKTKSDIPLLNILVAAPTVAALILATLGVTRSLPRIPPTISAAQPQTAFFPGLKKLFTSKSYLLILLVMGGGIGMFNTLYTVMQQLLCPMGYENQFSGLVAGLMIIGGVFGAAIAGWFVDRTKKYELTMKACLVVAVVIFVALLQLALRPDLAWLIVIAATLLGLTGLATYPVGLEMSAECSYPVVQTLSTGMIALSGQIQSVIYILVITMLERELSPEETKREVCSGITPGSNSTSTDPNESLAVPKDLTISTYAFSAIAVLLAAVLVIFFKPTMRRMRMDRSADNLKSLSKASDCTTPPRF